MILGDLEKTVLRYFWEIDAADAKQVHAHFEKIRGGSLNTIQATLDRLFKKGLLHRSKQSHAFIYESAMDKHTFLGKLIDPLRILLFSYLTMFFPAFMSRRLNQWMLVSIEQRADESAMEPSSCRISMAQTLVKVTRLFELEKCSKLQSTNDLCAYTGSSLEIRIRSILKHDETSTFVALPALAISFLLLLLSVFLVDWFHHSIELFLFH